VLDARRSRRIVAERDGGRDAVPAAQQVDDAAGVVVVHGDDEPAGVGLHGADRHELLVGLIEHGGKPFAAERQRGPQALPGSGAIEGVVERVGVLLTVGTDPFHVPVDAREVHRAHHATVPQRLAVAVLVVGRRFAEGVVVHEGNR